MQLESTGGHDAMQEVQQGHGIGPAGDRDQAAAASRKQAAVIKMSLEALGKRAHVRPKYGAPCAEERGFRQDGAQSLELIA